MENVVVAKKRQAIVQDVARRVLGHKRNRIVLWIMFMAMTTMLYILLLLFNPPFNRPDELFLLLWGGCFLLYVPLCLWVMKTQPLQGRGYWLEMGMIGAGAILFRILLLPLVPSLSTDVWRYLWDGRVIAHGYNPYLYAPIDKALVVLRDSVFSHADWKRLPSIYPPVAEGFFALGYLLLPTSVVAIKALFVVCDLGTCLVLTILLARKKIDPRRVIIYAWCPLPIVEFALQGHVDAVAIFFMVLTILCATSPRQNLLPWAGLFLGLATLTKLYPLILVLLFIRPRTWLLCITCGFTIILGYLPFMIFSHGHPLAAPLSAMSQTHLNPGIFTLLASALTTAFTHNTALNDYLSVIVEAVILFPTALTVVILYQRKRMSLELAILILLGIFIMTSANIFPWYATALLPWLALTVRPVWRAHKLQPGGLAIAMVWYFTSIVMLSYFLARPQYDNATNWLLYRITAFGVVFLGWFIAIAFYLSPTKQAS